MKTIHKNCNPYYISLRISKMKSTFFSILLAIAILNLSISCSYYTVRNVRSTEEKVLKQVQDFNSAEKYVVIHSGVNSWHLNDMIINEDNQTVSGSIQKIDETHLYEKPRESKKVHRYDNSKSDPLNELHLYLKQPTIFNENTQASIPLSDIVSISINDKNTDRSFANVVLTTVGVVFVVGIIYLATKSSCPFVYIKNGEEFDFVGELYPGRITANMQNDDYLPLPNSMVENNEFILKVSNQLKEIQHTDQLQLLQVNHDKDVEVLMDSKGVFQTFQKIEAPIKANIDGVEQNITPALLKDNEFYAFNTSKATSASTRNVIFEFDKPKDVKDAKLYLTAKNSVWLDYIFGKFNEQFGSYYNTFQKKQQNIAADSLRKWSNGQHIPLNVYVKAKDGWKLVERIITVGPMAMRNMVVPIKLDHVDGNKLQVKLETGFMFWEIDYVGIDFTKNIALQTEYINPSKAIDHNGNNVTNLLTNEDQKYFTQPNIGDEVIVHFPINKSIEGLTQSFFLKNRGYYNYIRDYKGVPDFVTLKSFREDDTFTRFSEKAYFEFANFDLKTLAYHE